MNTFVPHGQDFARCAQDLDKKRLGKQLVECEQIFNALTTGAPAHILHHPATQMWDGHRWKLACYAKACHEEWVWRYGKSHASGDWCASAGPWSGAEDVTPFQPWLDAMAPLHRAKLYSKDPEHYFQYDERTGDNARYPVTHNGQVIDWVERVGKRWKLDGVDNKTFPTGWAAIQFARSIAP
jgi:hypothetical protein